MQSVSAYHKGPILLYHSPVHGQLGGPAVNEGYLVHVSLRSPGWAGSYNNDISNVLRGGSMILRYELEGDGGKVLGKYTSNNRQHAIGATLIILASRTKWPI